MTVPSPTTVRQAAVLVAIEGVAGLVAAVAFVIRGLAGANQSTVSGFGNAAWFAIVGCGVLAAGWALWTGRRWGRGVAVFTQLLLLPVSWYIAVGSHQWLYGIPIAVVALVTLVLLFSPSALRWLGAQDSRDSRDSANADNSGPDTR